MKEYRLYDVKASANKAPGAYTIYLPCYEAPFCFLGAYGDVEDFLDLSHEFGHFCDACINSNTTASLDLAETYSQAMANLALLKSKETISADGYRNLLLLHLLSNLGIFAEQTAYADFECKVYALPDEELTVENVNALALDCACRFGAASSAGDDELYAVYWSQVTHLFEQPYYVISYCVSADAAIQIAEKELNEPGAGVACYEDILNWKDGDFLAELERVGLVSPFDPGRAAHNLALVESLVESELGDYLDAA
jgi:oligoendopeptidase F